MHGPMVPPPRLTYNRGMDRERLQRWLRSPHRTWRWRHGDAYERYQAVSSTDEGLLFYVWSHEHGEDGMQEGTLQPYAEFAERGPLVELPEGVDRQLRDWVATWLAERR